jgi:hypothetical protein
MLALEKGPVYTATVEGLAQWEELDGKDVRFEWKEGTDAPECGGILRPIHVTCVACGRWRGWYPEPATHDDSREDFLEAEAR